MIVLPPQLFQLPQLYETSGEAFWEDEHISAQMLHAHLDDERDGASRSGSFMDESVRWIGQSAPAAQYPRLLDLGCGPGLYARRFANAGYEVTGIDLSPRSIAYAKKSAGAPGPPIEYRCENYLELQEENTCDLITLIYCDFGALSSDDRARLLGRIYRALRKGGRCLLDVFSMAYLQKFRPGNSWGVYPEGGFWSERPYLALQRGHVYEGRVILEQTFVCSEQTDIKHYNLWNCCFAPEDLQKELRCAGFVQLQLYGDVAGAPLTSESPTLAVWAQKP